MDNVCQAFDAVTMATVTVVIVVTVQVYLIIVAFADISIAVMCVFYRKFHFVKIITYNKNVIKNGFYRGIPECDALTYRQLLACKGQR